MAVNKPALIDSYSVADFIGEWLPFNT